MPIPRAQTDAIRGDDLPLLYAVFINERNLKQRLRRSPFNSIEDVSYLFNPTTGILQDAKEAIEEVTDVSMRTAILELLLNTADANQVIASLNYLRNSHAPGLDIDSLQTLHQVLHNLPIPDHRPGHGERHVGALSLHLELSPGTPYSHSLIPEENNPVDADYVRNVQQFVRSCWQDYLRQYDYGLCLHAVSAMPELYLSRKKPGQAKAYLHDELKLLASTVLKISTHKKLNLQQRIGAMAHRLHIHLQAKQDHIRLFGIRNALGTDLPVSYGIVKHTLAILRQRARSQRPLQQARRAFRSYALLDASLSSETREAKHETNTTLVDGHRRSIAAINQARKQASMSGARLLISYWCEHKLPDQLRKKHIRTNLQALLDQARARTNPRRSATERARWLFFSNEALVLCPYISLSDPDALIRALPQRWVSQSDFGNNFVINTNTGRVYLQSTYNSISDHTAAGQTVRDPATREIFTAEPLNKDHINWGELNRLLNLKRLQAPEFEQGLERHCSTKIALDNLSHFHPALLHQTHIALLNSLHPERLDITTIQQINRLVAAHGEASTVALLDQCVAHGITLSKLTALPPNLLNHQAAAVLNEIDPASISSHIYHGIQRCAETHGAASTLALLSHCLRHHIDFNELNKLTPELLDELQRVDSKRTVLLPQRIKLLVERSGTRAGEYRKHLENGLTRFWRRHHKTGRLEHYEDVSTTLQSFMPSVIAVDTAGHYAATH